MTKEQYIDELMSSFYYASEEVPCQSGPGAVRKVSFTSGALRLLLAMVLNSEHIVWKE